jgi:hypothetical protein
LILSDCNEQTKFSFVSTAVTLVHNKDEFALFAHKTPVGTSHQAVPLSKTIIHKPAIGAIYLVSGQVRRGQNITGFAMVRLVSENGTRIWNRTDITLSMSPGQRNIIVSNSTYTFFSFRMEEQYATGEYTLELKTPNILLDTVQFTLEDFVKEDLVVENLPHATYENNTQVHDHYLEIGYILKKTLNKVKITTEVRLFYQIITM